MSILTVIDAERGSDEVIETGHELANGLEQEQVVLHVVPTIRDRERERTAVAMLIEDALGDTGLPTIRIAEEASIWERDSPSDRIADRIIEEAEATDAEYIVIGSRKRSPIGKVMLGNVAQLVLLSSTAPVVIVEQDE